MVFFGSGQVAKRSVLFVPKHYSKLPDNFFAPKPIFSRADQDRSKNRSFLGSFWGPHFSHVLKRPHFLDA